MIIKEADMQKIRHLHSKERIVFTGGGFDLLHAGHVEFLEFCKQQGDILVVGIASDENLRKRKGKGRPITKQAHRAYVVNALKPVDYVCIRRGADLAASMVGPTLALQPDCLVLYKDIPPEDLRIIRENAPDTYILIDQQSKSDSTTDILRRLRHG